VGERTIEYSTLGSAGGRGCGLIEAWGVMCSAFSTRRRDSAYDVVFIIGFMVFIGSARLVEEFLLFCSFVMICFFSGGKRCCRVGEAVAVRSWKGAMDD